MMRKMIVELLYIGQFETLFLGTSVDKTSIRNMANCEDCAIISLTMQEIDLLTKPGNSATTMFATELQNIKNRFFFESEIIEPAKNVTTISLSIMQHLRKTKIGNTHAA